MSRRKPGSRLGWLALGALFAWAFTTGLGLWIWATLPGPGSGAPLVVDWPENLDARSSADRLAGLGLIKSPRWFALYLRLVGATPEPGPHLLNDRLSPRELVQRLARLKTRPALRVTVPEGYNQFQIADRLEKLGICSSASFRRAVSDRRLLDELGIRGPSAEGWLFPASYDFALDSAPAQVIRGMVREMQKRLERLDRDNAGALARLEREKGMTRNDVLTLASIVEREASHPDERKTIASVFFNRLEDPTFLPARTLQSDPTAGYGCLVEPERIPSCTGFDGRISPALLRDPANRWNTYRHPGLPPGPIANPGEAAISAVLAPARTEYLFFVARGDGRHTFSRTFAEHTSAVEQSGPAPKP